VAWRKVARSWRNRRQPPGRVRRPPGGGIGERVDQRLKQQEHQQVRQHIDSGGARVGARRPLQADQAFQPFEGEFDAPAQTVESEDVGGGERLGRQRGDQDHPIGCRQRRRGDLVPAPLRLAPRRAAGRCGGLRCLLDSDQTQRQRRCLAPATDPIGSILQLFDLDLPVPDHSTLSRRAATLEMPRRQAGSRCTCWWTARD
jgi:hypothetical protein